MKIQMFPAVEKRRAFYARVLMYQSLAALLLFLFWMWHKQYTGYIARGYDDLPRIFDSVMILVWSSILVIVARVSEFDMYKNMVWLQDRVGTILYLFRQFFLHSYVPLMIVLSIIDVVLGGNDLYRVVLLQGLLLYYLTILYLLFAGAFYLHTRRDRLWSYLGLK